MPTLIRIADASTPPATWPANTPGCAFYIGGNTPHTWTSTEIAEAKRRARYLLPIFTRSNPAGVSVTADGAAIAAACRTLGQPHGTLVAVDLEAGVDPTYVRALDDIVHGAGWVLVIYGQLSTITRNPAPRGGYWVGDWDGVADDPSWTGKQYSNDGAYDLSEFAATAPLWDTQAPAAAPPAQPERPTVRRGSAGYWVGIAQRSLMLAGRDPHGVDDQFGAETYAAVESFQTAVHIGRDGVVGPDTWGHLEARTLVVQRALAAHGYGKGGGDSTAGPETAAELFAFQHAKGLLSDGICGTHTSAALGIAAI